MLSLEVKDLTFQMIRNVTNIVLIVFFMNYIIKLKEEYRYIV